MTQRVRFIKIPEAVSVDKETLADNFGRFTFGPLARGWGWTMGTVLRRAMLSSVEGAASTQFRIDGVIHEFSTIEGVLQDVPLIVLNIKKLRFRLEGDGPEFAALHAVEPRDYTAADLELPPNLKLVNPDAPILTLTVKDKPVHMEIKIEKGRGYENQEAVKKRSPGEPTGTIFLDAFYSPVRQVKIDVNNVRFGDRTDYEQVVFEVFTDGSVKPEETLSQTAELLRAHVAALASISEPDSDKAPSQEEKDPEWSNISIESLEIPQTVKKALIDHGITVVSELVKFNEDEILGWGDIKPRSFATLRTKIQALGAEFSTKDSESKEEDNEA